MAVGGNVREQATRERERHVRGNVSSWLSFPRWCPPAHMLRSRAPEAELPRRTAGHKHAAAQWEECSGGQGGHQPQEARR